MKQTVRKSPVREAEVGGGACVALYFTFGVMLNDSREKCSAK